MKLYLFIRILNTGILLLHGVMSRPNYDDELLGTSHLVHPKSEENDDEPTTTITVDECNITTIISKSSGKITSVNHPNPYPTNCKWSYIIHVGEGHSVKMVVEKLDLSKEDVLTITPSINANVNMNYHPHVVSAESNSTQHFEVDAECCDSVIIKFEVSAHWNNHTGFSIIYERNEGTTRKPSLNPSFGWNQVYLCGLTVSEFDLIEPIFEKPIIDMAEKYYDLIKISEKRTSNITHMRMLVNGVIHCPKSWPWSANCIQVNFSIVEHYDSTELSSKHLSSLWDKYRNTDELIKLGIWEYAIPDVEWLFWFWISLLSFMSLFFSLLLVIIIKTKLINFYFKKLKIPDFGVEVKKNIENWTFQNSFAYPLFTAENSNRFRFRKAYERAASEPTYARNECHYSNQG